MTGNVPQRRGRLSDTGACPDPVASSPASAGVTRTRRVARSAASAPLTPVGRGEQSAEQTAGTSLPAGDGVALAVRVGDVGSAVEAGVEYVSGRWPSLVVETGVAALQLDLDDSMTGRQVRRVVAAVAEAAEAWLDEVLRIEGIRDER